MEGWKYATSVTGVSIFQKLAARYSIPDFPVELELFILQNNSASPERNRINFNGIERIFDHVFSFNVDADQNPDDGESVWSILDTNIKHAIPFGADPFGNIYYYCIATGEVLLYKHELDMMESSHLTFSQFTKKLY